ncbi:MAG: hypothetical protein ACKN80_00930, partial [Actinomycetales bacterium]
MAKTLEEKMNHPKKPEVKLLKKRINASFPAGRMLIATPKVIEKTVRSVKKGKTITVEELREKLAKSYRA